MMTTEKVKAAFSEAKPFRSVTCCLKCSDNASYSVCLSLIHLFLLLCWTLCFSRSCVSLPPNECSLASEIICGKLNALCSPSMLASMLTYQLS